MLPRNDMAIIAWRESQQQFSGFVLSRLEFLDLVQMLMFYPAIGASCVDDFVTGILAHGAHSCLGSSTHVSPRYFDSYLNFFWCMFDFVISGAVDARF